MKKLLADTLFLLHLGWAILMLLGTVLILFSPTYLRWHLGFITSTLVLNISLGYCPLTAWEEKLRRSLNPNFSYDNSFVASLGKKLGVSLVARDINWIMTALAAFAWGVAMSP